MKFYHRIRTKLAFAFLLVTLIPAIAIGVYSMWVSSQSLLNQELSAQAQRVHAIKQRIESFLGSARGDVSFLGSAQPLTHYLSLRGAGDSPDAVEKARRALEKEFMAFSISREIYYQVRYLDETGQEVVRVDSDGVQTKIVAQDRLQNKAKRYYFADAVDLPLGSIMVSPLDLNREHGKVEVPHKPVIRYAVPVHYADGKKAGVVLTNIDAKRFLADMGGVMLVDKNGYDLANPDPTKTWGSKRDLDTGANYREDFGAEAAQVLNTDKGSIENPHDITTYQKVSVPGSMDQWVLVLKRPKGEVLASVTEFRNTFLAILAGALLVSLILALVLDARITKPIEYLTAEAERVSTGDLMNPVEVDDKGEIGQLAEAFERMRVSMVRMMDRMQKRRSRS